MRPASGNVTCRLIPGRIRRDRSAPSRREATGHLVACFANTAFSGLANLKSGERYARIGSAAKFRRPDVVIRRARPYGRPTISSSQS
jgi:hypothetical protein